MNWFFLTKLLSGKRFEQFSCHQKIPEKFKKYSLSEITKIKKYHNESCSSRVSKKSKQAKNSTIDEKSSIVVLSVFVKLGEDIHLISTLCC